MPTALAGYACLAKSQYHPFHAVYEAPSGDMVALCNVAAFEWTVELFTRPTNAGYICGLCDACDADAIPLADGYSRTEWTLDARRRLRLARRTYSTRGA